MRTSENRICHKDKKTRREKDIIIGYVFLRLGAFVAEKFEYY